MAQFTFRERDDDPFATVAPAKGAPGESITVGGFTVRERDDDPLLPDIDWAGPDEAVRAEVDKLEGPIRKRALHKWAESKVARDRKADAESTYDYTNTEGEVEKRPLPWPKARERMRQMVRGTPIVGAFMPEISAHINELAHKMSDGKVGGRHEEVLAYEDALNRALDQESPKEAMALKLAGGLATGGPVTKALLSRAEGLLSKSAVSSVLGGGYAYTGGFGESRAPTLYERHQAGMEHLPLGMGVGAVIPPALSGVGWTGAKVADVVTPQLARARAAAGQYMPKILASADETASGLNPGAWAQALQMAANQLRRAGRTEEDIRAQIAKMDEARTLFSSGKAQDVAAIVDLDPSLAELVAYAARQDPGARNWANIFFRARQTGHEQPGGHVAAMGLPTRERMGPKLTAGQAARDPKLQSKFGAGSDENMLAVGQGERIEEDLRRLFQLQDKRHHSHQQTAEATDATMRAEQRAAARENYGEVRRLGKTVDIGDVANYPRRARRAKVTPANETFAEAFARWTQIATDPASNIAQVAPLRNELRKALKLFVGPDGRLITNIDAFDQTKRHLDRVIQQWMKPGMQSARGINPNIGDKLDEMLRDLVNAVDRIKTNSIGARYREARDLFGSVARLRQDIQTGRDLWSGNADKRALALEKWRSLKSDERKKLVRFGYLDAARRNMAEMGHGHDKTRLFDKPSVDEMIRELAPRTQTATGREARMRNPWGQLVPKPLAQTPQRFARLMELERRMGRETPQIILGGSPTQKNAQVDAQFEIMSRFEQARELWHSSGNLTMAGLRFLQGAFTRLFGMRADTSQAIARQMLTADPARRQQILNEIYKRMGPDKFDQFMALLKQHELQLIAAGARATTQPATP